MSDQPALPIHHQLISVWKTHLNAEVRSLNENFFEIGGDRQAAQKMLEEVKRATGTFVSTAMFLREPTISGLTRILLKQADTGSLFVPIQKGRGRDPFYFFHGDILGGGFYSKRLATFLGDEQPFHISAPIDLSERELPRVEELAARKRGALQARQPVGPYILGGFCVGAVVAYEVARQLEVAGKEVAHVILIEPEIGDALARSHLRFVNSVAARNRRPRDKVETFMHGLKKVERLRSVWHGSWHEKMGFLLANSKKLLRARNRSDATDRSAMRRPPEGGMSRDWRLAAYHWVLTSYVPKPYRGRVTMLVTQEHMTQAPFIVKQWQKAAPQIEVKRIPGTHLSCITHHLAEIAAKIRVEIDSAKAAALLISSAMASPLWLSI